MYVITVHLFEEMLVIDQQDYDPSASKKTKKLYQLVFTYSIIIVVAGYTVMHPSFTRPVKTDVQPMHTDIWHFENNEGFARIRSDMIKLVYI